MLQETKDGWKIDFGDCKVAALHIDYRLTLDFVDQPSMVSLIVETPFTLSNRNLKSKVTPSQATTVAPALALFNSRVQGIVIQTSGSLKVAFEGDQFLEIEPNEKYEAWQICSEGLMIIGKPGGGVSIFKQAITAEGKRR